MKNFLSFLFFVFIIFEINAQTQQLDVIKLKCFGGNNFDYSYTYSTASDSSFCIGGATLSPDGDMYSIGQDSNQNAFVLFVDTSLNAFKKVIWGGEDIDNVNNILQVSDTSFFILFESKSQTGEYVGAYGGYDIYLRSYFIKQNWLSPILRYGGSGDDKPNVIRKKNVNGYLIGGSTYSNDGDFNNNFGGKDCFVINLTSNYQIAWAKNYGGSLNEEIVDVFQLNDGNIMFFGITKSTDQMVHSNKGGRDVWIVKLNSMGDTIWTKCLGGSGDDYVLSVKKLENENFMIVGCSYSQNGDFYFVKNNKKITNFFGYYYVINSSGQFQYGAALGEPNKNVIFSDAIVENNGVANFWGIKSENPYFAEFNNNFYVYDKEILLQNSEGEIANCISLGDFYYTITNTLTDTIPSYHAGVEVLILKTKKIVATSMQDIKSFKIDIFPNPASDYVYIQNYDYFTDCHYSIYDISGKKRLKGKIKNNQINIKDLAPGTYLLSIDKGNIRYAHGLVKCQ